MKNCETYRPHANLVFAGIGVVLCGLFVWSSFYQGGAVGELTSIFFALAVLSCIYTFLIRPKICFGDEGIIITNPLDEFTIGWGDVIQMDTRWALTIETKDFTVSAWAATASGRHRRNIHHSDIKGLDIDFGGSIRTADSPNSDSGAAAYRARVRQRRFQDLGNIPSIATSRKRDFKPLAFVGVALALAIATNALGH